MIWIGLLDYFIYHPIGRFNWLDHEWIISRIQQWENADEKKIEEKSHWFIAIIFRQLSEYVGGRVFNITVDKYQRSLPPNDNWGKMGGRRNFGTHWCVCY